MVEINHSFAWGGYRPGSGQKPKWNSGATMTIRVPASLAEDILSYARLVDGQFPQGMQVADCLSCGTHHDSVTQSSDLTGQLEAVTQERDQLDRECNSLAEKVGMLHLQIEELRQHHDSVTESRVLQALGEVLEKNRNKEKGYEAKSFSRGLNDLRAILEVEKD